MSFCVRCLVVFVLLPIVLAEIKSGRVTLKPSGVLSMRAEWEDTPKDGAKYDIFILTTLISTGTVKVHRLNNLVFNTSNMSYNVGSDRQDQFIAGNTATSATVGSATFPGFVLNNWYKVSIRYYNGSGFQLNKPGGEEFRLQSQEGQELSAADGVRQLILKMTSEHQTVQCSCYK